VIIKKALKILFKQGPGALFIKIRTKVRQRSQYRWYLLSVKKVEDGKDIKRERAKAFQYRPKVSIIVPVYNTNEKWLRLCIKSLLTQVYDNWELCIVDGGSTKPLVREVLEGYAKQDGRIKVKFLTENKGIAGNSNEALALASGEFVGFLDHDDELASSALYEVVKLLNEDREIDFIYSDEDKISGGGKRFEPHFKPNWSPDTLRSYNYIAHFAVIRKKVIDEIGGFREGYDGSQDHDLFLRVVERTQKIVHIPKILYHWRSHPFSAASSTKAKKYAYDSGKKALNDHINRIGLNGKVSDGLFLGSYYIKYHINGSPAVSIIIPNKDKVNVLGQCINSILQRSFYKNYKIFIVDNQSIEAETFKYYKELKNESKVKILYYNKPFNFSAINNYAVSQIDSEYIIFLNNDTEVISSNWIEAMLEFAQRRDVGAVGALLYYPNDTIQHAGVILGIGGVGNHSHKHFLRNDLGYMGRAKIIQNLSAVTAACLMTKKEVFYEVEGFDEKYSNAFNDVDFCLKIRKSDYLIVYTPYAELYHHESLSRGYEDTEEKKIRFRKEIEFFQRKWRDVLTKGDPYYNPNLTLDREDFSIRI
jgi:GT2 family glycosyltransferase